MTIARTVSVALLALNMAACASMNDSRDMASFQCPLGNMTEINVSSPDHPREFAIETAARAALRDGYEHFWIVKDYPEADRSYTMLVRMVPNDGKPAEPDMVIARDVLRTAHFTPLPSL